MSPDPSNLPGDSARVVPIDDSVSARRPRRARAVLTILIPMVLFSAQAIWLFDFSIDDASVSFRYAQHLADGLGLRWNPERPPVEGYSNLLWVIILAGGHLLGMDIEFFAHLLGLVLGLANLVVLYVLCRRVWSPRKLWWAPVLLVSVCPYWAMWVMSGLEIALFGFWLLFCVLGLTAHYRVKPWLIGIGVVGLALTRPEGAALAVVPLVVGWLIDRHDPPKARLRVYGRPALALVLAVAGLTAFRLAYFGYPFANTVYAKFSLALPSASEVGKWALFGLPFFASWILALRDRRALPHPAARAAAISLVVAQVLLVLPVKPVMYFLHRYQIALLPLLVLAVPLLTDRLGRKNRWAGSVLAAGLVLWTAQGFPSVTRRHQSEQYAIQRQRCVVEGLQSLPGRITVALIDAGRIPYWSDFSAIDIWGLCDADVAHRGFTFETTLGRNPDVYVMSMNIVEGKVYPRLGYDVMIAGTLTFKEKFRLWRICAGTPPTTDWYYDYGIFINTEWAARNGLTYQELHPR